MSHPDPGRAPFPPPAPPLGRKAWLAILAFFFTLTAAMTWPVILNPHRMILGTPGDSLMPVWNLWWTRRAIVELHQMPFFGDVIFRPFPIALMHHAHNFFYGLVYCVGGFIYANPVFWLNACIFSSFIIAGVATFLLARLLTASTPGALLAGVVFSFCSFRVGRAGGHINLLSNEYIPLYMYLLARALHDGGTRYFCGAAICAGITLWCEYYNFLFVILITVSYLLLGGPLECFDWRRQARAWRGIALATLVFLIITAPFLWGLHLTVSTIELVPSGGHDFFRALPGYYLLPSPYHALLHPWMLPIYLGSPSGNTAEPLVFLGYAAMVPALYGLARTRRWPPHQRFLLLLGLGFFILSLGPWLHLDGWGGGGRLALPYQWLMAMPHFQDFRVPARFSVMVMLAVALLAAFGMAEFARRVTEPRAARMACVALVAFSMIENLQAPWRFCYDIFDSGVIPFKLTRLMRADPVPGAVMQLPAYPLDFRGYWIQPFHNRPLVNSHHDRMKAHQLGYYYTIDLSGWFGAGPVADRGFDDYLSLGFDSPIMHERARLLPPGWPNPWTRESVERFCAFFDLRFLLIPPIPGDFRLRERIRRDLLPLEAEHKSGQAWLGVLRRREDPLPIRIDSGSMTDNCFFLRGFSAAEAGSRWALGDHSEVAFRIVAPEDLELTLSLGKPPHLARGEQKLTLLLNGTRFSEYRIGTVWSTVSLRLPRRLLRGGYNYLKIVPEIVRSPASVNYNEEGRALTAQLGPIVIDRPETPAPAP